MNVHIFCSKFFLFCFFHRACKVHTFFLIAIIVLLDCNSPSQPRLLKSLVFVLQDDEYVVFSPEQVRLKYVVQYSLPDEQLKCFQPHVDTSAENTPQTGTSDTCEHPLITFLAPVSNIMSAYHREQIGH